MSTLDHKAVLAALTRALPGEAAPVELHEPLFDGNENKYLAECISSGWVSSVGKFVDRFEAELAAYTGAKRAIAVVNGTAALHVALKLAGVGAGNEVLIPTLTFIATANAVSYCGATSHLVDSEERTLGIDVAKLNAHLRSIAKVTADGCVNQKTGKLIKAVVPMHAYGHPVDLDALLETCARYKITLIEDAAESLGSYYKGRHTGTLGRLSALSFNGNKIVTTGGGGAILTNDEALGKHAKHLTTTAKLPHAWAYTHDEIGFNYRLPNLNAALGCAQLEQLPRFVAQKRALARHYEQAFAGVAGVKFFNEPEFTKSNYWLNAILLDREHSGERDRLLSTLQEGGYRVRPTWTLMHKMSMYTACPRMDLASAEDIEGRLINLPSSVKLGRHGKA